MTRNPKRNGQLRIHLELYVTQQMAVEIRKVCRRRLLTEADVVRQALLDYLDADRVAGRRP
jgi:hypothetical protein